MSAMPSDPLDQRSRQVLFAVIAEFVQTAEPVGSRAVARRHIRGLSPATIRNAMADLEDLGFLNQPHTSAGRVPTDKAYRFYVDHLQEVVWKPADPALRMEPLGAQGDATERVMAEAPARLSIQTHMTSMLLSPPLKQTALDRIELAALGDERALAIVVTETGWVTARPMSVPPRLGTEELREIGRTLTRRHRGRNFQDIIDDLTAPADPLEPLWTRNRALLDQIVALLRDRTLYVSGATRILDHPDLSEVATARTLLRAFEDKQQLIELLSRMAEQPGVQVMIGRENPLLEMQECSLITSTYRYRDQALGVLGVLGPRRMAYSDIIELVDESARTVSSLLSRVKHQLYLPS